MRHTSDNVAIDLIALGILRRGDNVVMVRQIVPGDRPPAWVLPGGLVEAGELVTEALIREVREEAGVQVDAISHLACMMQLDRPVHGMQTIGYFFEVSEWSGDLGVADPDDEVLEVALVPIEEAIHRLATNGGWPSIQTPLLSYLKGECLAGTLWLYREDNTGQHYVADLPSQPTG